MTCHKIIASGLLIVLALTWPVPPAVALRSEQLKHGTGLEELRARLAVSPSLEEQVITLGEAMAGTTPRVLTPVPSDLLEAPAILVVLAGGAGKRMGSDLPKPAILAHGKPMVRFAQDAARALGIPVVTIMGNEVDALLKASAPGGIAIQHPASKPLGTAHGVLTAEVLLRDYQGTILVALGDMPWYEPRIFQQLLEAHQTSGVQATYLTAEVSHPESFARVVRLKDGKFAGEVQVGDLRILAERGETLTLKDGTVLSAADIAKKKEVGTGTYAFDARYLFEALKLIRNNNEKGEFYLPSVLSVLEEQGHKISTAAIVEDAIMNVDTPQALREAELLLAKRTLARPTQEWTTNDWIAALDRAWTLLRDPVVRDGFVGEGRPLGDFLAGAATLNTPWHHLGLGVLAELVAIYGPVPQQIEEEVKRYLRVVQAFEEKNGSGEVVLVRAPGRGMLMGAHNDYNWGPELLLTLPVDTLAVIRKRTDALVRLSSTDSRFPSREFNIARELPLARRGDWDKILQETGVPASDWANYLKGSVLFWQNRYPHEEFHGMDLMVDSTLPMERGVSSSSALVVIGGIGIQWVNQKTIDPIEMAKVCCFAEWYVGTRGGGLDHAISILGQRGHALKLLPDSAEPVAIPLLPGYRFIMADSLIPADKTGTVRNAFNQRSAETRVLGLALFKAQFPEYANRIQYLRDITAENLHLTEDEIDAMVESLPETVSQQGLVKEVPEAVVQLTRSYQGLPEPPGGWKIRQRVRHIVQEVRRVQKASSALQASDMKTFGNLMHQSFESCRRDYEITVPGLDELAGLAREIPGVLGVGIQGGGFGGFAMILAEEKAVGPLAEKLFEHYYKPRGLADKKDLELHKVLFTVSPSRGAGLILPEFPTPSSPPAVLSGLEESTTHQLSQFNLTLKVPRGVFPPTHESSQALQEVLQRLQPRIARTPRGAPARVIDIGTGSGVEGLVAKRLGAASVVATDLDARAVAVAAENAQRNGITEGFETAVGDLFKPVVGRQFDLAIYNAHSQGAAGRFLSDLSDPDRQPPLLAEGGVALLGWYSLEAEGLMFWNYPWPVRALLTKGHFSVYAMARTSAELDALQELVTPGQRTEDTHVQYQSATARARGAGLEETQVVRETLQRLLRIDDLVAAQRRAPEYVEEARRLAAEAVEGLLAAAKAAGIHLADRAAVEAFLAPLVSSRAYVVATGYGSRFSPLRLMSKQLFPADGLVPNMKRALEPVVAFTTAPPVAIIDGVVAYHVLAQRPLEDADRQNILTSLQQWWLAILREASVPSDELPWSAVRPLIEPQLLYAWHPDQQQDLAAAARAFETHLDTRFPGVEYEGRRLVLLDGFLRALFQPIIERTQTSDEVNPYLDPQKVERLVGRGAILALGTANGPGGALETGYRRAEKLHLSPVAWDVPVQSDQAGVALPIFPNAYLIGFLKALASYQQGIDQAALLVVGGKLADAKGPSGRGLLLIDPVTGLPLIKQWKDLTPGEQQQALTRWQQGDDVWVSLMSGFVVSHPFGRQAMADLTGDPAHWGHPDAKKVFRPEFWYTDWPAYRQRELARTGTTPARIEPFLLHEDAPAGLKDAEASMRFRDAARRHDLVPAVAQSPGVVAPPVLPLGAEVIQLDHHAIASLKNVEDLYAPIIAVLGPDDQPIRRFLKKPGEFDGDLRQVVRARGGRGTQAAPVSVESPPTSNSLPGLVRHPEAYVPGAARLDQLDAGNQAAVVEFMRAEFESMAAHHIPDPQVRKQFLQAIPVVDLTQTPEQIYQQFFQALKVLAAHEGVADPWAVDKQLYRDPVRAFALRLLDRVQAADTHPQLSALFDELALIATQANLIDSQSETARRLFTRPGFFEDFERNVQTAVAKRLAINMLAQYRALAMGAPGTVLYVTDNFEEAYVDVALAVLLTKLGHTVIMAGKAAPARGDATVDDLRAIRDELKAQAPTDLRPVLDQIQIISNGTESYGTFLHQATPAFRAAFKEARFIVLKGQGNLYTTVTMNALNTQAPVVCCLLSKGYTAQWVTGVPKLMNVLVDPAAEIYLVNRTGQEIDIEAAIQDIFAGSDQIEILPGRLYVETTARIREGTAFEGTNVLLGATVVGPGRLLKDVRADNTVFEGHPRLDAFSYEPPSTRPWGRIEGGTYRDQVVHWYGTIESHPAAGLEESVVEISREELERLGLVVDPTAHVTLRMPPDAARDSVLARVFVGGGTHLLGRVVVDPTVRVLGGAVLDGREAPVTLTNGTFVEAGGQVIGSAVRRSWIAGRLTHSEVEEELIVPGETFEIGSRQQQLTQLAEFLDDPVAYVPGAWRHEELTDAEQAERVRISRARTHELCQACHLPDSQATEVTQAMARFLHHRPTLDRFTREQVFRYLFSLIRQVTGIDDPLNGEEALRQRAAIEASPVRALARRYIEQIRVSGHPLESKTRELFHELAAVTTRAHGFVTSPTAQEAVRRLLVSAADEQALRDQLAGTQAPPFVLDDRDVYERLVFDSERGTFLYLVNSREEAELDAAMWVLLAKLGHQVVVGAKARPIVGDAVVADIQALIHAVPELQDLATADRLKVVSTGTDADGLLLNRASPELLDILKRSDLRAIILKGLGYLYTLPARNALKVPVITQFVVRSPSAREMVGFPGSDASVMGRPVLAEIPLGEPIRHHQPDGTWAGTLAEVIGQRRAEDARALTSENFTALTTIFGSVATAQAEIDAVIARTRQTIGQVVLGRLDPERLQRFLANDPEGFVERVRSIEEYDAVIIGGGASALLQNRIARARGWRTAAIVIGSDNGGISERQHQNMRRAGYGETLPTGDITNALIGSMTERERWVLNHRGLMNLPGHTFEEKVTALLARALTLDALPSWRQTDPNFLLFAVELLNLARLVDAYFVVPGVTPWAQASVRHEIFNAIMVRAGAYQQDHPSPDPRRFMVGLYLLEKAFGLTQRILVNSVDPQTLYAEWRTEEGEFIHREDGQVAISNAHDAQKQLPDGRLARFGFTGPVRAYPETIQAIQRLKPGGLVIIGPSSFVVSIGPSLAVPEIVEAIAARQDVAKALVLNLTRNNETVGWTIPDYLRFYEEVLTRRPLRDTVTHLVVNDDFGNPEGTPRERALWAAFQDAGDGAETWKRRGAVPVRHEDRQLVQGKGVRFESQALAQVVAVEQKVVSTSLERGVVEVPNHDPVRLGNTLSTIQAHFRQTRLGQAGGLEEAVKAPARYVVVGALAAVVPANVPDLLAVTVGLEQSRAVLALGRIPASQVIAVAAGLEERLGLEALGVRAVIEGWRYPRPEEAVQTAIRQAEAALGASAQVLRLTATTLPGLWAQLREILPSAWAVTPAAIKQIRRLQQVGAYV